MLLIDRSKKKGQKKRPFGSVEPHTAVQMLHN